jgi:hypothetical protein
MLGAYLRRIVTRVLLPLSWHRDDHCVALTLKKFSEVEFDSAWQYFNAMKHAEDPALQRILFGNFMEEMEHADAFLSLSHDLALRRFARKQESRSVLVKSADDIPYFLAFAHESERSIATQFDGYALASGHRGSVADAFRKISSDEITHGEGAHSSLVALVGNRARARRLIWRVKLSKLWQAWVRATRYVGDGTSTLLIATVYLLAGITFGASCRRQLRGDSLRPRP